MATEALTGTRIRERRLDRGLRQADLAQEVGISPSYLNLIEHNRRRIAGKLLADLARVLRVDPVALSKGADAELLTQLRAAASRTDKSVELARTEELAEKFPGWASLITSQARRIDLLENHLHVQKDRLAYDPKLAHALHEVISSVTAIRSSASILVGQEKLDADWQSRFHQNIHDDSVRLGQSSEALIAQFETSAEEVAGSLSPQEAVEAYLAEDLSCLMAVDEGHGELDSLAEAAGLGRLATEVLRDRLHAYQADALALPYQQFSTAARAVGYDPIALTDRYAVSFSLTLRRLASLRPTDGHPPMGLAVCDASGSLRQFISVPGFNLPRQGGACPLWPLYGALSRPAQPICATVEIPDMMSERFLCTAIAEPDGVTAFDVPPPMVSTMLVSPDPRKQNPKPIPVGFSCRICPRDTCTSRREPVIAGIKMKDRF